MSIRGGFHKLIYAPRQALTLCAKLLYLKKLLKNGVEHKMALRQTFSLYEIEPRSVGAKISKCLEPITAKKGYLASTLEGILIRFVKRNSWQ